MLASTASVRAFAALGRAHIWGMQVPLQVTLRDMTMTDALDAAIRKHASHLERFHHRITSCHVTIDRPTSIITRARSSA
jgi:hypothetical protein